MKDFHDFVIDIAKKDNSKLAAGFKEAYKTDDAGTLYKWFQDNGYGKVTEEDCKKLIENDAVIEDFKENVKSGTY